MEGEQNLEQAADKGKTQTNNLEETVVEKNEDVPEDFFDDFLKDDFIEGFRIIGEDNDPLSPKPDCKSNELNVDANNVDKNTVIKDKHEEFEDSRVEEKRRSRSVKTGGTDRNNKSKSTQSSDNCDVRRDPEKTRKAIQSDKVKSAKDKEKRLITDIMETGLVPPGMELEVTMNEVKKTKSPDKTIDLKNSISQQPSNSKQRSLSNSRKRARPSPKRTSPLKTEKPPHLKSRRSPPLKSRRSPMFIPRSFKSAWPAKRSRSRSLRRTTSFQRSKSPRLSRKSPKRSGSPRWSVMHHKSRSPRLYNKTWRRNWSRSRSRSHSPASRRRRSKSKEFNKRAAYSPSERRYKSKSPHKTSCNDNISFLESLIKIHEGQIPVTSPAINYYPNIAEPSYYVPVLPQNPPELQQYDPYDESFFIGNNQTDTSIALPEDNINKTEQLLADDRIKLSDILAIAATPQVSHSTPKTIEEKAKVTRLCQQAIAILDEKKFVGALAVEPSTNSKDFSNPFDITHDLQLTFTSETAEKRKEYLNFTQRCQRLLKTVKPDPLAAIVQAPTVSLKSSGCQTDAELSACQECNRRKKITYGNCGVQAGLPLLTFSVSTQVTEADFYSMIPKTQSLASLTPAQLLGRQSMLVPEPSTTNSRLFDQNMQPRQRPNQDARGYHNYNAPVYQTAPTEEHFMQPVMGQGFVQPKQNLFNDGGRRSGYSNQY